MPARVHYDGSYDDPGQVGGIIAIDLPDTKSRLWKVKYHWLLSKFLASRISFDAKGPKGTPMESAYVVAVSDPTDLGGDVCEYEITYAEVPKKRRGPPQVISFNYTGQFAGTFVSVTNSVSATVDYRYFFSANIAAGVTLRAPGTLFIRAGTIYGSEGAIGLAGGLAEAETCEVFMGHIYVIATKNVPPLVLST